MLLGHCLETLSLLLFTDEDQNFKHLLQLGGFFDRHAGLDTKRTTEIDAEHGTEFNIELAGNVRTEQISETIPNFLI